MRYYEQKFMKETFSALVHSINVLSKSKYSLNKKQKIKLIKKGEPTSAAYRLNQLKIRINGELFLTERC